VEGYKVQEEGNGCKCLAISPATCTRHLREKLEKGVVLTSLRSFLLHFSYCPNPASGLQYYNKCMCVRVVVKNLPLARRGERKRDRVKAAFLIIFHFIIFHKQHTGILS